MGTVIYEYDPDGSDKFLQRSETMITHLPNGTEISVQGKMYKVRRYTVLVDAYGAVMASIVVE